MKQVKINHLHVRFKGLSPQVARSATAGLGHQVLRQLAMQQGLQRAQGTIRITQVDLGSLRVSPDSTATEIRRTISQAIANTVRAKTDKHR